MVDCFYKLKYMLERPLIPDDDTVLGTAPKITFGFIFLVFTIFFMCFPARSHVIHYKTDSYVADFQVFNEKNYEFALKKMVIKTDGPLLVSRETLGSRFGYDVRKWIDRRPGYTGKEEILFWSTFFRSVPLALFLTFITLSLIHGDRKFLYFLKHHTVKSVSYAMLFVFFNLYHPYVTYAYSRHDSDAPVSKFTNGWAFFWNLDKFSEYHLFDPDFDPNYINIFSISGYHLMLIFIVGGAAFAFFSYYKIPKKEDI